MDMSLLEAIGVVFQPERLLFLLLGVGLGIIFGVIPGLTATLAIALLIPFTYSLDPVAAILMLLGLYTGTMYSNAITSITIRTPGNPAGAVLILDGYPLAQKGQAGRAIGISLLAGGFGGIVSVLAMSFLSPLLASVALKFSPVEYFAIGVFGLSTVIAVSSGGSLSKGAMSAAFGLLIATVGMDPIIPYARFTFGAGDLRTGVPFLPAVIGLFAIAEIFRLASRSSTGESFVEEIGKVRPSRSDIRRCGKETVRGAIIGTIIGILPGGGGSMASFVAYGETKRASKRPEEFGHGAIEGVASPGAADNAVTGGAMIPMLTLGIPGDAATAVLLGAFLVHGLQPGPTLFTSRPDIIYAIFVGMFLANILLIIIGFLTARPLARIATVPIRILVPVVALFSVIGAFASSGSIYDVYAALVFGLIGFVMEKFGYSVVPAVIGLILAPIIENSMRRSLVLSDGSWTIFVERPIAVSILAAGLAITVLSLRRERRLKKIVAGV